MDPPSYGRGPKGEIWKIEDSVYPFVQRAALLLSQEPLFFLINSYTTGLAPSVMRYMLTLEQRGRGGRIESGEIGLPVASGTKQEPLVLPCGASARWSWDRAETEA